ncbi:MAG: hypothetical protein GWP91_22415, partial [Rhodobacterales bacterium]|nr:hypothetical protein [Rhodobacterales bacterium]
MNERLQQLMSFHEGLEQNRRNALYASILLAVLVIAGVGYWSNSAATRAVMTHASYDDLTTALGVLDEAEIVGTIDNEGNLWVDSSQLGAAKRALVGKSHLHSIADVGELQPGLDPNTRKWALLRQAEGDIAKTLNDYDYVLASNVAITPFHEGLFKGEDEPATASIQLKLRPNTNLSQEQVRSVVASVSNSVRGLDPDRVTITDQSGNLLADGTGAEGGTIADVGSELATLKLSHER